jgi:solute carrier family 35 protein E1
MAIARVPVSTVHTVKVPFFHSFTLRLPASKAEQSPIQALSPLFTVLSYVVLFGVRYTSATYFSLLPLTIGVMLACSFDISANGSGLLCALGSTIIFVSQNIFSKKLLPKESFNSAPSAASSTPSHGRLDKLNLLFYSSGMAFLLMIPIWFYTDVHAFFSGTADVTDSFTNLFYLFFLNGTVNFGQNLIAFTILARTSPVTYSVASLIKRIAVICLAIVWWGQTVYAIQAFGMALTFLGLFMYNSAKGDVAKGERKRKQVEKKHEFLLPTTKDDDDMLSPSSTPPPPEDPSSTTTSAGALAWEQQPSKRTGGTLQPKQYL